MRNYYLKEYAIKSNKCNKINPLLNVVSCNSSLNNNDTRQESQKGSDGKRQREKSERKTVEEGKFKRFFH